MSFDEDIKKFEDLYKEHFVFLSLVSFQITKDREAAKDIVQDFFIYFWNKEQSTTINTSFRAYGSKAVKNLSLQYLEKIKRVDLEKNNLSIPEYEDPINFEKTDDRKIVKVLKLLDLLPESRRNIFISHVINDLSYSEIAETYNISINTVKTQMKRSYAFIREKANGNVLLLLLLVFNKN
ncbi:sigma-70 family RNA polymerase sigma factor [Flavobacterium sp. LT1R49]|uniref:sigma-70 family RNA polymerase sigma factor n=1 Tax=Flavobacterium arabinosi TaxID=3398737 RepID=UPI003A8A3E1B